MIKFLNKFGFAILAAASTAPVFAAVDTAAATTEISGAGTAVGVIGGAVLAVMVGIKVFKWMRGAL